jgi:hypothetical protein
LSTTGQVKTRIEALEQSFKAAYDFMHTATGEGLMESDPPGFRRKVLKMCPQYYELEEIMSNRSKIEPKATSDDINLSDDDEFLPLLGDDATDNSQVAGKDDDDGTDQSMDSEGRNEEPLMPGDTIAYNHMLVRSDGRRVRNWCWHWSW